MDGPGQEVFAGAAFAGDQDRDVAAGVQLGLFDAVETPSTGKDRLESRRMGECGGLPALFHVQDVQQAFALQRPLDGKDHFVLGNRLDEIIVGTFSQAIDGGARVVHGGDHDAFGGRAGLLDDFQQGLPVHFRHAESINATS